MATRRSEAPEGASEDPGTDGLTATVRRELRAWLEAHWDPELTVRSWWALLAGSGWGYPAWPADRYGRGLGPDEAVGVLAEIRRAGALPPAGGIGPRMVAPLLLEFGTEDQQQRLLRPIATGEEAWCQFFSEPGAGSDLGGLQTRARRDGDQWVVTGQKLWSGGAMDADRAILLARTDSDQPKHRGISFFLITVDQPGVEVRPIRQMDGQAHFNEIFLTDARVSDTDLLGGVNNGWALAMATLAHERTAFFGGGAGGFGGTPAGRKAGMLDVTAGRALALLRAEESREGDGGALRLAGSRHMTALARRTGRSGDAPVRQRLAGLHAAQEAARVTTARARAAAESGRPPGPESSLGKLTATRNARLLRDLGPDLLGPHGMLVGEDAPDGGEVAATTLYVPCLSIMGGTDEIQHNIVGERVLGLPREPQVDRDVPFRELRVGTQRG